MTQWSGGPALPPGVTAPAPAPQPIAQTSGNGFVLPGYSTALQGAQTSSQPWVSPYLGNYLTYGYGPEHQFIDYTKLSLPAPPGAKGPIAIPGTGGLALTAAPVATTPGGTSEHPGTTGGTTTTHSDGSTSSTGVNSAGGSSGGGDRGARGGIIGFDQGGNTGADYVQQPQIQPREMGPQGPMAPPQFHQTPHVLMPHPITGHPIAVPAHAFAPGQGGGGDSGTGSADSGHDAGGSRGPGPGARGAPGFARDAVDFGFGILGGAVAPGFGVATALARTALDPSYNAFNPFGLFGRDSSAATEGAGANQGGSGTTIGNENAGAKAAATGTNEQGGYSPGVDTGGSGSQGNGGAPGSGPDSGGPGPGTGGLYRRGGLLAHAARLKKGGIADAMETMAPAHSGLVRSDTPGRADKVLTSVPIGSYVFPADIVAHAGDGNTLAGAKTIHSFLQKCPKRASGGAVEYRHVYLSGGEVIGPHEVTRGLGGGDTEKGARYLDRQVLAMRRHAIKHLKGLPAPKR